ncbi:MAG: lipid-A-disaccharide synthase [Bryobacteraceae bacterium]
MAHRILVSAGEASGDLYAAMLVERLRRHLPETDFFGCAGPRMRAAGVRPVALAENLSVVGLLEVVAHIPRVYGEFRKMVRAARAERPDLAILTDSPDFHLRLAARLKKARIPVVYLVAPQVWAWRKGRIRAIRWNIERLLCIFPFEEEFFRRQGVAAHYIGHPLAGIIRCSSAREAFFESHGLDKSVPLVALLPGSRRGEAFRHLPYLLEAAGRIHTSRKVQFALGSPQGFWRPKDERIRKRLAEARILVLEGQSWDLLAHADLALAASGTVTVEAALLGTPMVTYYRVSQATWHLGRRLVDVPYYSMVNLVADRKLVPELIQNEMSGETLAAEAVKLLKDADARERMRAGLAEVAARLRGKADPMEKAAGFVREVLCKVEGASHVA